MVKLDTGFRQYDADSQPHPAHSERPHPELRSRPAGPGAPVERPEAEKAMSAMREWQDLRFRYQPGKRRLPPQRE